MRSDLRDAGVFVSSETIRSGIADVRLKGRIPRKKPYLDLQQHYNDYSGQWNTLIGQMIIGHKLYRVSERVNINVALFSYARAFSDGPRNLEPCSSDADDN
ncbi:hypothetical protein TNCV_3019921 [Trichonephila clavipes]|nr:hypothetical protein TNCV_3019921 [Trichonephila clavipes]